MSSIIQTGDGRQVVVSSDLGKPHLKIWAFGGSLGIDMTAEQAMAVAGALIHAARRARRALPSIEARSGETA